MKTRFGYLDYVLGWPYKFTSTISLMNITPNAYLCYLEQFITASDLRQIIKANLNNFYNFGYLSDWQAITRLGDVRFCGIANSNRWLYYCG
jgi:hypothetical protein